MKNTKTSNTKWKVRSGGKYFDFSSFGDAKNFTKGKGDYSILVLGKGRYVLKESGYYM